MSGDGKRDDGYKPQITAPIFDSTDLPVSSPFRNPPAIGIPKRPCKPKTLSTYVSVAAEDQDRRSAAKSACRLGFSKRMGLAFSPQRFGISLTAGGSLLKKDSACCRTRAQG